MQTPCIILFDDIDQLVLSENKGKVIQQALHQLLVEMDGFDQNEVQLAASFSFFILIISYLRELHRWDSCAAMCRRNNCYKLAHVTFGAYKLGKMKWMRRVLNLSILLSHIFNKRQCASHLIIDSSELVEHSLKIKEFTSLPFFLDYISHHIFKIIKRQT